MDNKNQNIIRNDLRLLKHRLIYRVLYIGGAVVILFLCFLLFRFSYDRQHQLRNQDEINAEEIRKEMDRTYADSTKLLAIPFLVMIFAYLRLSHIKSISFYRKELGLDNNDHDKQVLPPAQSDGKP